MDICGFFGSVYKVGSSEEYFFRNVDGEGKSRALSRTRLFLDFGLVMNQP